MIALTVLAIALTAVITSISYSIIFPVCYLLTVTLLLRSEPQAAAEKTDGNTDREFESDVFWRPSRESRSPAAALQAATIRRTNLQIGSTYGIATFFAAPQVRNRVGRLWLTEHVDQDIAKPSYFLGPVADDFLGVTASYIERCILCVDAGMNIVSFLTEDGSVGGILGATGVIVGMIAGGVAGLAVAAVVVLLNLSIVVLTIIAAVLMWRTMLLLDSFWRLIGRVGMPCPACHMAVTPPIYRCPGCGERHKDIRPGPRGIVIRNCTCETRFPTSLLLGAGNLAAECRYCGIGLPDKFGKLPEIVIPFFGGLNVGKTQLMYALWKAMKLLVEMHGGTIEPVGDSADRMSRIEKRLANGGRPDKTLPETPRAYVLRLKLGLEQRLIYLVDAAGELHYGPQGLDRLNYLEKARLLVFVADPLSADCLWELLPAESQAQLASVRSSKEEGELAYQKTREQMRRMGSKRKYARLALVVSKADLVDEMGTVAEYKSRGFSVRDLMCRSDGLDLGNIVREAEQNFASVEFFCTSAAIGDVGMPDDSVVGLGRWLLWSEGIRLG